METIKESKESEKEMSEYISREEFLKRIKPYDTEDNMDKALYNFALNTMIETPNANVVEREKLDKAIKNANDNIDKALEFGLNECAYGMREILDMFIKSIGGNNDKNNTKTISL